MLLECLQRVDDDGTIAYMHKLLGNILSHTVAGPSGYDHCVVHKLEMLAYFLRTVFVCVLFYHEAAMLTVFRQAASAEVKELLL